MDYEPAVHSLYDILKLSAPSVSGKLNLETLQRLVHMLSLDYTHAEPLSKQPLTYDSTFLMHSIWFQRAL